MQLKDIEDARKGGHNIRCSNCLSVSFNSDNLKHYCRARDKDGNKREGITFDSNEYYELTLEEYDKGCKLWFYFLGFKEEEIEELYGWWINEY